VALGDIQIDEQGSQGLGAHARAAVAVASASARRWKRAQPRCVKSLIVQPGGREPRRNFAVASAIEHIQLMAA